MPLHFWCEMSAVPSPCGSTMNSSFYSSPDKMAELERIKDVGRIRRITAQVSIWLVASLFISFEYFVLSSAIGSWLLGSLIPHVVISYVELLSFFYISLVVLYLGYHAVNPFIPISTALQWNCKPISMLNLDSSINLPSPNTSPTITRYCTTKNKGYDSNIAWVDAFKFGTPTNVEKNFSPGMKSMLNRSNLSSSMSTPSHFDSVMNTLCQEDSRVPFPARVSLSNSPHNKMLSSIHTPEQLDRLLSNDGDLSHIESPSAFKNGSLYFNMLNVTGTGEKKEYQVSEPSKLDSKDGVNVSCVHISGDRVELSPTPLSSTLGDEGTRFRNALHAHRNSPNKPGILRRTDSIERRRRSHSSPDRSIVGILTSGGSHALPEIGEDSFVRLTESEFQRCEPRVRVWIVNTILKPLHQQINKMNEIFDEEYSNLHLRIGISSVESLKTALLSKSELGATPLPFLLQSLAIHGNQAYLVSRISELSSDPFMKDFKWNGGGSEPRDDKNAIPGGRVAPLPWGEHLPNDAVLILDLFAAYMDAVVCSTPFVGNRINQPFSYRFLVKSPAKAGPLQHAPERFYLHMPIVHPPHVDFIVCSPNGTPGRIPLPKGANNLFRAIIALVHHAKVNNGGRIDHMNIGKEGINMTCILA